MIEDKRQFITRLFATIANRYDLFNRLSSLTLDRRWRALAVEHSRLEPGSRVLDLCTGTGDLALACADEIQGRIVGVDVCAPMLHMARQKATHRHVTVDWLFGDALSLPFRDASFARVLVGFSTRNLANLPLGLREMYRVLEPHGRLVILETGKPNHRWLRIAYFLYLRTVVVAIGWLLFFKAWPFTYLQRSVARFWEPHEFVRALREVGFRSVHYRALGGGIAALYVADKN